MQLKWKKSPCTLQFCLSAAASLFLTSYPLDGLQCKSAVFIVLIRRIDRSPLDSDELSTVGRSQSGVFNEITTTNNLNILWRHWDSSQINNHRKWRREDFKIARYTYFGCMRFPSSILFMFVTRNVSIISEKSDSAHSLPNRKFPLNLYNFNNTHQ